MNTESRMFAILALDPGASIKLSEHTGMWYVSARIGVSDGVMLTSEGVYRSSPAGAVAAFFEALTSVDHDHVVVTERFGLRREYRWNGAAFAEQSYSISERCR